MQFFRLGMLYMIKGYTVSSLFWIQEKWILKNSGLKHLNVSGQLPLSLATHRPLEIKVHHPPRTSSAALIDLAVIITKVAPWGRVSKTEKITLLKRKHSLKVKCMKLLSAMCTLIELFQLLSDLSWVRISSAEQKRQNHKSVSRKYQGRNLLLIMSLRRLWGGRPIYPMLQTMNISCGKSASVSHPFLKF